MIIKKKKDNNLICIASGNEKQYFTSINRAGLYIGLAAGSIKYAMERNSILKNKNDEDITIKLVDGSEIPYKLINNY